MLVLTVSRGSCGVLTNSIQMMRNDLLFIYYDLFDSQTQQTSE